MRIPPAVRSGSRINSCGPSGGGNAPSSGGAVRRAGASLATVTGRQSGAVESEPFSDRRRVAHAASPPSNSAMIPASANSAARVSRKASCRGGRPSGARYGHCEESASGSHWRSRRLSRLLSRFNWSGGNTAGRVQAAITKLSAAISGARRRPRSAITSPSASPSRSHCRSVCSPTAATSRSASSGARSKTACSAWPGAVKTLLRRRAPSSTKPSSSRAPIIERAPSSRNSETSEPSRQASTPAPPGRANAAAGSRKLSSGFLRTAQLSRSASSIAPYIENGSGKGIETGIACAFLKPGLDHGVAAAAQP